MATKAKIRCAAAAHLVTQTIETIKFAAKSPDPRRELFSYRLEAIEQRLTDGCGVSAA